MPLYALMKMHMVVQMIAVPLYALMKMHMVVLMIVVYYTMMAINHPTSIDLQ
ncbi:MAG: hypothetical protein MJE68_21520 [Proteobacteria bacterium]|nr:hypothetical protein [Pseudomonadota bacterium]